MGRGGEAPSQHQVQSKVELLVNYKTCCTQEDRTKYDATSILTNIKLLVGGTLVLSRYSWGRKDGNLPGDICHCDLDILAEASSFKGYDNRRVFEIMKHFAKQDEAQVRAETCERCKLPCLV